MEHQEKQTVQWQDFQVIPGYVESPEDKKKRLDREARYRLNKDITKDYRKLTRALGKRQGTGVWIPDSILRIVGNFTYAGVLMRIIWHCGNTGRYDGWMYKKDNELGSEVYLTVDQVRTARKRLLEMGYILAETHRANGHPVTHYAINAGNILGSLKIAGIEISDGLEQALLQLNYKVNPTAINFQTQKTVMAKRRFEQKN